MFFLIESWYREIWVKNIVYSDSVNCLVIPSHIIRYEPPPANCCRRIALTVETNRKSTVLSKNHAYKLFFFVPGFLLILNTILLTPKTSKLSKP